MVIFPKLSSDTLVPLFQPKSRHYMIILPKLSSDTLGVSSDLKHPTYHINKMLAIPIHVNFLRRGHKTKDKKNLQS